MNVLAFSCLHTPYMHPRAVAFLRQLKREYAPDAVVCLGDEIDAHGYGKYPKDPAALGTLNEIKAARRRLEPLYELFPTSHVCQSNHTDRLWKRAFEAGLPEEFLRGRREILHAPDGWRWARRWEFDGVTFIHGDGFSGRHPNKDACTEYRSKVVLGHVHSAAGVYWSRSFADAIWGLSVGCLIDDRSLAFKYAQNSARRPVLGAGVVVDGVPQFIPLR